MFKILNHVNLESEHICCALSEKKGEQTASLKKVWLKKQLDHGLVFRKLDARAKVFIEYIPAENAFAPIEAPNYYYINCFWVSGRYKNQGLAKQLLESAIHDAKVAGKDGLVILSSKKKKPFLSEGSFFKHHGFDISDTSYEGYELLSLSLKEGIQPKFRSSLVSKLIDPVNCLYYSHQCPHTDKYAKIIKEVADKYDLEFQLNLIEDKATAQIAPNPFTTYALYLQGEFVTNEILTEKKFIEFLTKRALI